MGLPTTAHRAEDRLATRHGRACRAIGLALAVLLGAVAEAGAGGQAILVRVDSIELGALGAIVAFSNGQVVDTRPLIIKASAIPYASGELLIHELATGATRLANADVLAQAVIPIDGGSATTLGGIFVEPGDVVLFETPSPSPIDPLLAETFLARRPAGASERYVTPPVLVPEPALISGLAIGVASLAGTSHRRGRRRGAPSPTVRRSTAAPQNLLDSRRCNKCTRAAAEEIPRRIGK